MLILEVLLLLKNVNIRLCTTCPPCPRSGAGTSPRRTSQTWQSVIRYVLQREKQKRRKPAPDPNACARLAGMGARARPGFGSPSQADPSETWRGVGGIPMLALAQALRPARPLSLKLSGLFAVRVYLGRREAPVWDGEGFMALFSQSPKLPQQPTAPAEEGDLEIKSVTRWQDAGMLFSWILPILMSQPGWSEEKTKLPWARVGAKHHHELGWEGNMGQDFSHLLQGSCVPSSTLR